MSASNYQNIPLPEVFYVIASTKEKQFAPDLQHPLSILNSAYGDVRTRLTSLLLKLEACAKTNQRNFELLLDYESLLISLCKFWDDDTTEILKAFTGERPIGRNSIVKAFNGRNKSYLTRPSNIINKIKHEQRKLLSFNAYINDAIIPGFFVGMNSGGKWRACSKVHYRSGDMAFSFYYELRRIFTGLYDHGHSLAEAIKALDSGIVTESPRHDEAQAEIARKIFSLPLLFFPNEVSRPTGIITDSDNLRNITESQLPQRLPFNAKVYEETAFSGDGVTRSFDFVAFDWKKYNRSIESIA